MKIKNLPDSEKPRERLIKYGADNLSNEDLLSIILRTGTKEKNVKLLSQEVLTKIKNVEDLNNLSLNELTGIKGLGKVKAITIMAALELGKRVANKTIEERLLLNNVKVIHDYFANLISDKKHEELLIILLDRKKRLLSYQVMYRGTFDELAASPKEIFNYAIKEEASGIIVMHNHPSGDINPSEADINMTNNLITTGRIVGIHLLDHIITNGKEYYSFFDEMVKHEV